MPHKAPEISNAVIFGCAGTVLSDEERAFFAKAAPWGFVLFARNVETAPQLRALCADLRAAVGWNAPVFMDQEGGTVQRLRPPLARNWADANAELTSNGAVHLRHRLMAAELRAVGVDGNFAPVIDLAGPETHPFLTRRIWAHDPDEVARIARAARDGLLAGGVLPCIKHLPGHGSANADSHFALPRCNKPLKLLETQDFAPVRALADTRLGMTSHVVYSALDPNTPATHSRKVLDYLRSELGFSGLLMSDDIYMNALGGDLAERSARALAAGVDLVLHCSGDLEDMKQVARAVGKLSKDGQERAERALLQRLEPAQLDGAIDIAALAAEFDGLNPTRV